jgi:hypothetical protein
MKRHHHARPVSSAAVPRAARYHHPARPEGYGQPHIGPSPRAHQLEPLPGSRKPPRRPRTKAPKPANRPAVLVYRQETSSYLSSFSNTDRQFQLFSQPHPLPPDLTAYPVQYLCRPQSRYTGPNQCDLMLQSPYKQFLSGLRLVEVPQQAALAGVTMVGVGDYKANRHDRELLGRTLVAVYGKPGPYDTYPGWLVLLVGARPYAPKHRLANARAAVGMLRDILPDLAGWLAPLLADETGPSEVPI